MLLPRDLLVEQVRKGLERRAVLLLAGPGYGKTTLLAQVVARLTLPCAWLSCDERMRESGALLAHLSAALLGSDPGGPSARGPLDGSSVDPARMCNEVGERTSEVVIVLDDLHLLAGAPSAGVLGQFLSDLPDNAHLALASRGELPFPQGHLLVQRSVSPLRI